VEPKITAPAITLSNFNGDFVYIIKVVSYFGIPVIEDWCLAENKIELVKGIEGATFKNFSEAYSETIKAEKSNSAGEIKFEPFYIKPKKAI